MAEQHNVGRADQIIRIFLGLVCVVLLGYHLLYESILPLYALIAVLILIPFFLKTGITRVCPVMKAMKMSTTKRDG